MCFFQENGANFSAIFKFKGVSSFLKSHPFVSKPIVYETRKLKVVLELSSRSISIIYVLLPQLLFSINKIGVLNDFNLLFFNSPKT